MSDTSPSPSPSPPRALLRAALAALEGYEFRSFCLGFERARHDDRGAHEAQYRHLKRALGRELERRLAPAQVQFERPDLQLEIAADGSVRAEPAPVFYAGRYRKLSRRMSASRWVHHACRGRGCEGCRRTGVLCRSIEDLLTPPTLALTGGERLAFHGLGREDTDARMLGAGRPFALEVFRPRRRDIDLAAIETEVAITACGDAEVLALRRVDHTAVAAVKAVEPEKTYRAWVRVDGQLPSAVASVAEGIAGREIEQLSPERVKKRRGEFRMRRRRVVASTWLGELHGLGVWEVRVESGTYIKELVSGDGGRTSPSLAELLGVSCRCEALDVLDVHWPTPESSASVAR